MLSGVYWGVVCGLLVFVVVLVGVVGFEGVDVVSVIVCVLYLMCYCGFDELGIWYVVDGVFGGVVFGFN